MKNNPPIIKILVACEVSGRVRDAFRKKGHDAWSCDVLPNDSPYHIQDDVLKHLNDGWDMMIAHPPCTHLSVCGARHFHRKQKVQEEALGFVRKLLNAPIPKIALENPVSIISSRIRKPEQIIQPWMFGESYQKTTCLWLKGLPRLVPTKIVDKGEMIEFPSGKRMPKWYAEIPSTNSPENAVIRSNTFQGIADAMADQWPGKGVYDYD